MNVVRSFLETLFAESCPCFAQQCKIEGLLPWNQQQLLDIEQSAMLKRNKSSDKCAVIFSSKNSDDEVLRNAKSRIRLYLGYMVDLGLLKESSHKGNIVGLSETSASMWTLTGDRPKTAAKIPLKNSKKFPKSIGDFTLVGGFRLDSADSDINQSGLSSTSSSRRSSHGSMDDEEHYQLIPGKKENYTLWNGSILNWKYIIKGMQDEDLPSAFRERFRNLSREERQQLAKVLFWFFRKGIVDNLIAIVIGQMDTDESNIDEQMALSAGSINLTSDYDINVYGHYSAWIGIAFETRFQNIFGATPDYVFDTNIYSSSFMVKNIPKLHSPQWYKMSICGNESFYYINFEKNPLDSIDVIAKKIRDDQHVWAALKVAMVITKTSKGLTEYLDSHNKGVSVWYHVKNLLKVLNKVARDPHFLVIQGRSKISKLSDLVNHLSVINYKGSETYYTRGAFLDVVVDQQLCKYANKEQKIHLDLHTYFDSFIENLADYCLHEGKPKYLTRVRNAGKHVGPVLKVQESDIRGRAKRIIETEKMAAIKSEDLNFVELLQMAWSMCEYMINRDHAECLFRVYCYVSSLEGKLRK